MFLVAQLNTAADSSTTYFSDEEETSVERKSIVKKIPKNTAPVEKIEQSRVSLVKRKHDESNQSVSSTAGMNTTSYCAYVKSLHS